MLGLLAGCGEDRLSKSEYEQKLRSEYAGVQQAFQATASSIGQPELADKIAGAQAELRDAADSLEDAEPPEAVEEENEEIVEGLREYADDLDELREAAERNDLEAIEAFNERIAENEAVERIAEAAEEMKHKGYDVGPIGEE
jgi:DNA-binding transcriptional regulator GbsR (MarR family)